MGRKFRLSVHRKNEERTRKISPQLIVSARLDSVSLMTSSSGVLPHRSSRDHSSALSVLRKCSFVVSIQRDAVSVMSVSLPAEHCMLSNGTCSVPWSSARVTAYDQFSPCW